MKIVSILWIVLSIVTLRVNAQNFTTADPMVSAVIFETIAETTLQFIETAKKRVEKQVTNVDVEQQGKTTYYIYDLPLKNLSPEKLIIDCVKIAQSSGIVLKYESVIPGNSLFNIRIKNMITEVQPYTFANTVLLYYKKTDAVEQKNIKFTVKGTIKAK